MPRSPGRTRTCLAHPPRAFKMASVSYTHPPHVPPLTCCSAAHSRVSGGRAGSGARSEREARAARSRVHPRALVALGIKPLAEEFQAFLGPRVALRKQVADGLALGGDAQVRKQVTQSVELLGNLLPINVAI